MHLPGSAEVLATLHPGFTVLVQSRGWPELRPVQRAAAGPILAGKDLVLEAPTAGGKTEAVLFPSLTRVVQQPAAGAGIRILYLAPLRALLNDLEIRAKVYAEACGLHAFKWHGDVDADQKKEQARQPPELLLTTPESVEAFLLRRGERGDFFRSLQIVIVDEAHNFAAGDRGSHLVCLLERLGHYCAQRPQRIALTATIGNRDELLRWIRGSGKGGESLKIPGDPPPRDWRLEFFPGLESEADEIVRLYEELPGSRSLVFVRSRRRAEELAKSLSSLDEDAARKLQVRTHHGSVSRFYREEAEKLIRILSEDGLDAIISTSTLELGIDLGDLDQVFQAGPTASPSALLQRVGRTGRRPGRRQHLRAHCTKSEELPVLVATIELAFEGKAEALAFPGRAFHLLAHQLLCLSLERHGVDARKAWEVLRAADCFRGIATPEVGKLVASMVQEKYLREDGGMIIPGERAERELLGSNWRRLFAVFDSAPLYDVLHQRQQVGTLDASFASTLQAPFLFVLAGHLWSADRIDHDAHTIVATPARAGLVPKWAAFGGPDVPFETAQRTGALLHGPPVERLFLDETAKDGLELERHDARSEPWIAGGIGVRREGIGKLEVITYAGHRINRALAQLLESGTGWDCSTSYSGVRVKSKGEDAVDLPHKVQEIFDKVRRGPLQDAESLTRALLPTLKLYRFSPFARCLPPELHGAALIERALDCAGLVQLLQHPPTVPEAREG
jgi:ATP-dependent Lhr-like helicase